MADVAKHPWLTKRGDTYYVRARVPQDLVDALKRDEIKYSLRTKCPKAALTKVRAEAAKIEGEFRAQRGQLAESAAASPCTAASVANPAPLAANLLQTVCEQHYQTIVDRDFAWRAKLHSSLRTIGSDDGAWCDALNNLIANTTDWSVGRFFPIADLHSLEDETLGREDVLLMCVHDMQSQHASVLELKLALADVCAFIAQAEESVPGLSDGDKLRLARKLMEVERSAYEDILAQDQSRYDAIVEKRAAHVAMPSAHVSNEPNSNITNDSPRLKQLIDRFGEEGRREGLAEKTIRGDRTDLLEFASVASDKPVLTYDKADALAFKDVLAACPANRKDIRFHGKTIGECAKIADQLGMDRRLSTTTINDKLGALSKFFDWVDVHIGKLDNPFHGLRIKDKKRNRGRRAKRLPFNARELQLIFDSTVFRGCESRSQWRKPGKLVLRDSARFWAPLIALYSGMRLGEIIQLRIEDIKTDSDGIRYFDVTTLLERTDDEEQKSLKTSASERQIPIHPLLFECGLQRLINRRRMRGELRLLMDYGPSKADGSWSKNFSNWFNNQFRKDIGLERIIDGRNMLNFHSFRHNFEDAVRNLPDVKQEVRDALQGHGENGVSAQYGTGLYRRTLDDAMKEVAYPDLDLSHLRG